ncbi:hypothetical protein JCM3766R1_004073 [Sporobolomyces carnicolor]
MDTVSLDEVLKLAVSIAEELRHRRSQYWELARDFHGWLAAQFCVNYQDNEKWAKVDNYTDKNTSLRNRNAQTEEQLSFLLKEILADPNYHNEAQLRSTFQHLESLYVPPLVGLWLDTFGSVDGTKLQRVKPSDCVVIVLIATILDKRFRSVTLYHDRMEVLKILNKIEHSINKTGHLMETAGYANARSQIERLTARGSQRARIIYPDIVEHH